jgi:hypothetical protein
MRIIAFITFSADIHKILSHIGVDPEAPRIVPARGPPLWDECGAQEAGEGCVRRQPGAWFEMMGHKFLGIQTVISGNVRIFRTT